MATSTAMQRVAPRTAAEPVQQRTDCEACDRPSIEEWVLGSLHEHGSLTLDQVAGSLAQPNWSELFLAIDRLARSGHVLVWPSGAGDLVLSLTATQRKSAAA